MTIQSSAGVQLYIGTPESTPSPDDWILIGEVTNYGEFGRVYQKIAYDNLTSRGTQKLKGQYDDGALTLKLGRDPSDLGQAAVIAARDSDSSYNFKLLLNDAGTLGHKTTFTFKAQVMSYTTNIGGPNQVIGASVSVEIQSGTISEVAAS